MSRRLCRVVRGTNGAFEELRDTFVPSSSFKSIISDFLLYCFSCCSVDIGAENHQRK